MKKIFVAFFLLGLMVAAKAQDLQTIITDAEVQRVLGTLASDEMEGRRTFTKGIDKAASFIAAEFKSYGIQPLKGTNSYLQSFAMIRPKFISASGMLNESALETKQIMAVTCSKDLQVTEKSGYDVAVIGKGANLFGEARKYSGLTKNTIVLVDTSFTSSFGRLSQLKGNMFYSDKSVVFVLTAETAIKSITIDAKHEIQEMPLANVVGMIPGKKLPNEYVIFSGHYDHLGINTRNMVNNDSIYNGANDDAAGTTAMMLLAKYYAAAKNNERTLIFVAFTAEEVGGFGSQYFSKQFNPLDVKAMFNIEMIGSESKWGKNSAFITGYEKTDMGKILQGNLVGTNFTFYPDPYTSQNLFYRSDNATLARLGVPAHTISTTKIDVDPYYHKASDELSTIDIPNMTQIIRSIALSARGIINGKETPTRVDASSLR
ncbi:M28 family metallopeptidase [Sediminibacterium sp.]|uniref:M28 family metallopeptidase n=1 Tax=Sediminibacterium sp. TaxID=1917865 RepID=UPI003F703044